MIKTGDTVRVKLPSGTWVRGNIELASGNGRSLYVNLEEGESPPLPWLLDRVSGGQVLLLLKQGDKWASLTSEHGEFEVEAVKDV